MLGAAQFIENHGRQLVFEKVGGRETILDQAFIDENRIGIDEREQAAIAVVAFFAEFVAKLSDLPDSRWRRLSVASLANACPFSGVSIPSKRMVSPSRIDEGVAVENFDIALRRS